MTVIILLLAAIWTLAALAAMTLVWAHGARRAEPPEDYQT